MNLSQFRNFAVRSQLILGFLFLLQLPVTAQSVASGPRSYEEVHRLTEQGKFDDAITALNEISKSNPTAKRSPTNLGLLITVRGIMATRLPRSNGRLLKIRTMPKLHS